MKTLNNLTNIYFWKNDTIHLLTPAVPLKGGKCKYLCKCSLSPKIFPDLDWGTIPSGPHPKIL